MYTYIWRWMFKYSYLTLWLLGEKNTCGPKILLTVTAVDGGFTRIFLGDKGEGPHRLRSALPLAEWRAFCLKEYRDYAWWEAGERINGSCECKISSLTTLLSVPLHVRVQWRLGRRSHEESRYSCFCELFDRALVQLRRARPRKYLPLYTRVLTVRPDWAHHEGCARRDEKIRARNDEWRTWTTRRIHAERWKYVG